MPFFHCSPLVRTCRTDGKEAGEERARDACQASCCVVHIFLRFFHNGGTTQRLFTKKVNAIMPSGRRRVHWHLHV